MEAFEHLDKMNFVVVNGVWSTWDNFFFLYLLHTPYSTFKEKILSLNVRQFSLYYCFCLSTRSLYTISLCFSFRAIEVRRMCRGKQTIILYVTRFFYWISCQFSRGKRIAEALISPSVCRKFWNRIVVRWSFGHCQYTLGKRWLYNRKPIAYKELD